MQLDIRHPIGLMLAIVGALLLVAGLTATPADTARALGVNLSLWWGFALLGVGGVLLALARRARPPRRRTR